MLLIVSIIITAELYSTFKYHMKIGETTRCCSFFLRTHVKISSKISIIEFNIQIKWCIIVTPSREAEKDYQGYFNSPPHKKNHIATTIINTVLFKISTHILTKRMTAILNKIFSFKIKLYIHYNILFAIFYIYNSILYPFSSPKRSYSGANDSANYCSLAFRTPRFPIPSLQIHFS